MLWCYRSGGKWTKLKEVKASQTYINVTGLKKGKLYGVAVVPYVINDGVKTYGTANKTWMYDRRKGKTKSMLTKLG